MSGMTLVTFLRARLDEDEMTAMAAGDSHPWVVWVQPDKGYPQRVTEYGTARLICETYTGPWDNTGLKWPPTVANHIARHDPARVLADVQAKRAILDLHAPVVSTAVAVLDGTGSRDVEPDTAEEILSREVVCLACFGAPAAPCKTLQHLAAVYADHPDYDEKWRP